MAELGPGSHQTGRIATTLGVGAASVATVRQQLVNKDMVWSQRHGETAFTRAPVRQFHETTDADPRKTRTGAPHTTLKSQESLMNARVPKRNRLSPLGTVVVALAALLQPAPLAAVSHEFDLAYDPDTAVVAGTQVISFSRSEFGDQAVLLLLNNAGAVPNPYENPLMEDLRYQSGFEPGYTRITSIVDALGAEVPFEEFTPPAHGRLFTYPMPGLAVRLRLPPRDHYRLTVAFRTRLPAPAHGRPHQPRRRVRAALRLVSAPLPAPGPAHAAADRRLPGAHRRPCGVPGDLA